MSREGGWLQRLKSGWDTYEANVVSTSQGSVAARDPSLTLNVRLFWLLSSST